MTKEALNNPALPGGHGGSGLDAQAQTAGMAEPSRGFANAKQGQNPSVPAARQDFSELPKDHTRVPDAADGHSLRCAETGALLKSIANPNPKWQTRQEHCLHLPELCPASGNPGPGSRLYIRYSSRTRFLEVFSLGEYIKAFVGHPVVRDVELLTQTVARDCAQLLGHAVQVQGHFELPAIGQSLTVTVESDRYFFTS